MISAPAEGFPATHRQTGYDRERKQYPNENESVYDEIPDVISPCGNVLIQSHGSLIFHLCQQALGSVRIGRSQHHRDQGTRTFDHWTTRKTAKVGLFCMAIWGVG